MSEFNRGAACYLFVYSSLLIVESQNIMREGKRAGHQLVSNIILHSLSTSYKHAVAADKISGNVMAAVPQQIIIGIRSFLPSSA